MKLTLGTVQLGMDYGLANAAKPSLDSAIKMLDYATQNQVLSIDTAAAYGDAEKVVGEFIKKSTIEREKLEIISKQKPNFSEIYDEKKCYTAVKNDIVESLNNLKLDYLDGYLTHKADHVGNPLIFYTLNRVKEEGLVKFIGASVYLPEQAKTGANNGTIDALQVPFNLFDQRLLNSDIIDSFENKLIYVRSVFLQGLLLMNVKTIPAFLSSATRYIEELNNYSQASGFSKAELALAFVKKQKWISNIVFGIDNLQQLKEFIQNYETSIADEIVNDIAQKFKNIDEEIVSPYLWKRG